MKLTCCGKPIKFDDLNEGGMPEPDGRKQLQGICKHCGKLYYLQVIDSQDGFE